MKEDAKKFLKEKLGAQMSDEELDNVAGGTTAQNLEILKAMMPIDEFGVTDVFDEINKPGAQNADIIIAQGVNKLMQKHFGDSVIFVANSGEVENWNFSGINGNKISHAQVLEMINGRAQGWEVSN